VGEVKFDDLEELEPEVRFKMPLEDEIRDKMDRLKTPRWCRLFFGFFFCLSLFIAPSFLPTKPVACTKVQHPISRLYSRYVNEIHILLRFTGEEPRDLIQQFLSANPGM
jgi:hypothetical protein